MFADLRAHRTDLELSLLLLGSVLAIALGGLALDGDWPKVVRVAAAFGGYAGVVAALTRDGTSPRALAFVIAGGVGGLISGMVRPDAMPPASVAVQALAGALLLGPAHWLGLRYHRRVRPGS